MSLNLVTAFTASKKPPTHYYHVPAKQLTRPNAPCWPRCSLSREAGTLATLVQGFEARYRLVLRRMNAGGPIERKLGE